MGLDEKIEKIQQNYIGSKSCGEAYMLLTLYGELRGFTWTCVITICIAVLIYFQCEKRMEIYQAEMLF